MQIPIVAARGQVILTEACQRMTDHVIMFLNHLYIRQTASGNFYLGSHTEFVGFENRITFKLSGGEKRLVSLATVLAMAPEVLLLDEPTTGLDNNTKTKLIQVIKSLSISLIAVSHEFDFLEAATNKIYTLEDGKIHMDKEVYLHHHEHAHIMGRQPHRHI